MKIKNQAGFGHIVLVLFALVLVVIGLVSWKVIKKTSINQTSDANLSQSKQGSNTQTEAELELQNLGLASFDSIDVTTQAVREYPSKQLKGFYIFGEKISGGRTNPNFEYASVKTGSKIISSIDGVVGFIKVQSDSNDSEIIIQPKEGSMWSIGYDHVINVTVKKGDAVKAGTPLGEPALQNNGLRRFEIQVNKDEGGVTKHYCPTSLLGSNVKEKWLADLTFMQNKWEATTGLDLYDLTTQNPVGCITRTLTPQQAEGN